MLSSLAEEYVLKQAAFNQHEIPASFISACPPAKEFRQLLAGLANKADQWSTILFPKTLPTENAMYHFSSSQSLLLSWIHRVEMS